MILAGNPLFLFYLSNPDFTLRRSNKSLKALSTFFTNHQSTNQRSYPNQTIKLLTTSAVKFLASLNLPSPKPPLRPTISFSKAARAKRNRYLINNCTSNSPIFRPYQLFQTVEINLDISTLINISHWLRRLRSRSIYKKN